MDYETWRQVVGYEGIYSISSLGRLRRDSGTRGCKAGKILKPTQNGKGYVQYALNHDGERRILAHRMVLAAFIGPCPPGHVCNHLDGNKLNNTPANLEWVTQRQNCIHARDVLGRGMKPGMAASGDAHYKARLKATDMDTIKARVAAGEAQATLAAEYGVTRQSIWRVVKDRQRVRTDRQQELHTCKPADYTWFGVGLDDVWTE